MAPAALDELNEAARRSSRAFAVHGRRRSSLVSLNAGREGTWLERCFDERLRSHGRTVSLWISPVLGSAHFVGCCPVLCSSRGQIERAPIGRLRHPRLGATELP